MQYLKSLSQTPTHLSLLFLKLISVQTHLQKNLKYQFTSPYPHNQWIITGNKTLGSVPVCIFNDHFYSPNGISKRKMVPGH